MLGLASDDAFLQSKIPFESTPETQRLGEFASYLSSSSRRPAARDTSELLPLSLAELAVDRLQQQGNDAFKKKDYGEAIKFWTEALEKAAELNSPSPKKLQASVGSQASTLEWPSRM